jgi:SAM dependent carboxyl methyltransferase
MEGHGYYTSHSQAQQAYGELGIEWLEQAAAEVTPPAGPLPFVISDMGAAGGGNSLGPMRRALAARKGGGPALVVHTDIPSNDFSSLFELVAGAPETYLGEAGVFALAEGRSFFEPLFPPGFVSLGWSSIAVHWLSDIPEPIAEHIYCSFAEGETRDALRARSAADWRNFLAARALELRRSGRLVVVGGAALDDGSSGAEGLMDMANTALRELVDAGRLDRAEYARMTIPTWNRTSAEFTEPFEADHSLALRRHAERTLPDVYLAAYREDGDLDRYVAAVAGFFRAAFGDSLWGALEPATSPSRWEEIAAHFEELLGQRIADARRRLRASGTWSCSISPRLEV